MTQVHYDKTTKEERKRDWSVSKNSELHLEQPLLQKHYWSNTDTAEQRVT